MQVGDFYISNVNGRNIVFTATGAIRLCVAVQRQETTWHGVGRVSTQRSHYQFAAVMTLAMSGPHACLSGPGTLRKTGETVRLRIEAC